MKPSGVQFARPTCRPRRHTRIISDAARSWSAANIAPNGDITASKLWSANGSAFGIPRHETHAHGFRLEPLAAALREIRPRDPWWSRRTSGARRPATQ